MTTELQLLSDCLTKLNFNTHAVGMSFNDGTPQHLTTFREDWQEHYFTNDYLTHDPLPAAALSSRGVIRWKSIHDMYPKNIVLNEARSDFGMVNGFAMGFRGMVISAASEVHLTDRDLVYIQNAVMASLRDVPPSNKILTPKQKGLISLLRYGLQLGEAAEVMGVSLNSAKDMKKLIFRKLGASTTSQAIALAEQLERETP